MRRIILLFALGAMVVSAGNGGAALDDVEQRLRASYGVSLRWDNVEGPPELLGGGKPSFRRDLGFHVSTVRPGDFLAVWLPRGEMLRIHSPAGKLSPDDVSIFLSDGNGLYVPAEVIPAEGDDSLLVRPSADTPLVVRLYRPEGRQGPAEVALFISRQEPPATLAPYRTVVALPGEPVRITGAERPWDHGDAFRRLPAGQRYEVEVSGPARLSLETRFSYTAVDRQRTEPYAVSIGLDGVMQAVMLFEAHPERSSLLMEGGRPVMAGRLLRGQIDVPAGRHRLWLEPTADLYARLVLQEDPDYLFPSLNQTVPPLREVKELLWGRPVDDPAGPVFDHERLMGRDVSSVESTAVLLGRDNAHREGGMAAAGLLLAASARHPEYPEMRAAAREMLETRTSFRPLYPSQKDRGSPMEFARFITRELKEPGEHGGGAVVFEQHGDELLEYMPSGPFAEVPDSGARALRYQLPLLSAPGTLRIALTSGKEGCGGRLMVGFDAGPPWGLIVSGAEALEQERVATSPAEAGLAVLQRRHGPAGMPTLSGPFGMRQYPAALVPVKTAEMALPAGTREVRLWKEPGCSMPLRAALHYRASRPFRLSEQAFLGALSRLDDRMGLLRALVSDAGAQDGTLSEGGQVLSTAARASGEIMNELQPLRRLLASLDRSFSSSVYAPADARKHGASDAGRLADEARQLEAAGRWLPALQAWAEAAARLEGKERDMADLSMARVLGKLGEQHFQERLLRGKVLSDGDAAGTNSAFEELQRIYREDDDTEALLSLYAAALRRRPSWRMLALVAQALAESGEYDLALAAGLLLPVEERPADWLVRAAYKTGRQRTFDMLTAGLPDSQRALWQGLDLASKGDYEGARAAFLAGDDAGRAMAGHFDEGLAIRNRLLSASAGERLGAVEDWLTWQGRHPAPFEWADESASVADYAGSAQLYSVPRDVYSPWFGAAADRPLRLKVAGPLRLRIEARAVHERDDAAPLDGWIRVVDEGRLHVFPVTGNTRQDGLLIVGDEAHVPGHKIIAELPVGPGLHEIEVFSEGVQSLMRVFGQRPVFPLPALPPATYGTVLAALRGPVAGEAPVFSPGAALAGGDEDICLVAEDGSGVVRTRRTGMTEIIPPAAGEQTPEAALLREEAGKGSDAGAAGAARLLYRGDAEGALALLDVRQPEELLLKERILLWMAERGEGKRLSSVSLSEQIMAETPEVRGLKAMADRMRRGTGWMKIDSLDASAGLRYLESRGADPESPFLRVRRALMGGMDESDVVLYGRDVLVLSLANTAPSELEVAFSTVDVSLLPPEAMKAGWQLDEGPPAEVRLGPGSPVQNVVVSVPRGEHYLRVWISERYLDQFLKVRITDRGASMAGGVGSKIIRKIEKPYHVATAVEPVRFRVDGPALLQVHELRGGREEAFLIAVGQGLQTIELAPVPGSDERLVQLYRLVLIPDKETGLPRRVTVSHDPVPGPPLTVPPEPLPVHVKFSDAYRLGGQEDGTWSVTAGFVSRRTADEDVFAVRAAEQFVETGLAYRFFDEPRRLYVLTELLGRIRESGGPTLGLRGRLHKDPPALPVSLKLDYSFYAQSPTGGRFEPLGGAVEWSAFVKGTAGTLLRIDPKTFHAPSVALFGRVLSLDAAGSYGLRELDQDIFTAYKRTHRAGIIISDTLYRRPWLDTIWEAGISAATNEDMGISGFDRLSFSVGWRQLLGPGQVDARYRFTRHLRDDDRSAAANTDTLTVRVLRDFWMARQERLRAGVRLDFHLSEGTVSAWCLFTWHFGNGRAYRDIMPDELDFDDLRARMAPGEPNNGVRYDTAR